MNTVIPITPISATALRILVRVEERAEVFFAVFCAFFFLLFKSDLFAFFDGDTDDLHCWCIAVVGIAWRNGHKDIESFHDLAKHTVFAIKMGGWYVRDKEL